MTCRLTALILCLSFIGSQNAVSAGGKGQKPDVSFKIYSPPQNDDRSPLTGTETSKLDSAEGKEDAQRLSKGKGPSLRAMQASKTDGGGPVPEREPASSDGEKIASRVLKGYVRIVPSGTKIPIIMDTALDSDTSQEGDEFSARTAEDLTIDGHIAVPAGSSIRGRIARISAPRHLNRSGSVALKFDTVTTTDNRQIPIVANLVARGGVVHARRGAKDIVIESSIIALPTAAGLGIGLLAASSSSSSIGSGTAAGIGAGVGAAVGLAILLSKKGKRIDVRPGDELKIELAEDLRMPM